MNRPLPRPLLAAGKAPGTVARGPILGAGPTKRSGRRGSDDGIFGGPGGSGPLLRAVVLVIAVVVVLFLLARNCTGDDNAEPDFEDAVLTEINILNSTSESALAVAFEGTTVVLSGDAVNDDVVAQAEQLALDAGATTVTVEAVSVGGIPSAEPGDATDLEVQLAAIVEQNPITFAPGSTEVGPEADAAIALVAEAIKATPAGTVTITVVGHTDSLGEEADNLTTSRLRAEAVRSALIDSHGVPVLDLATPIGMGEAEPIADNETVEGQAANRRIEFRVVLVGEEPPVAPTAPSDAAASVPPTTIG